MAIMVPSLLYGNRPESHEDEIFHSLEKLPDDYFVFYSFKVGSLNYNTWKEKEMDFVIYNRFKGIMVIEAKSGAVRCERGIWKYASGIEMKDPFKQADDNRWLLQEKLSDLQRFQRDKLVNRCKFHFAVWFLSIGRTSLDRITLPQNADKAVILTAEDLEDPQPSIDRIFSYDIINSRVQTNLTDDDNTFILDEFLCPTFNILPSKTIEMDYKRRKFDQMVIEQSNILNYLEYQRNAVINGIAGTGKTLIAVEKARRHSEKGETVLFLVFNNMLKKHLEESYRYKGVDYYTIDGFACKMCSTPEPDYDYLESILLDCDDGKMEFPYQHVIVDEGQDFGQERMNSDTVFELLEDIIMKTENGTFYVFYDRLQMIQSRKIPQFIEGADCRLTLYKNCRNTKRIAETSYKPLRLDKAPKLMDSALTGESPVICFCSEKDTEAMLNKAISQSIGDGMNNIQIISCAARNKSIVGDPYSEDVYYTKNRSVPFTTVRKFKGLEADHVIMVDVNKEVLTRDSMLFYVGSSRAKLQLTVIANMDGQDCTEVLSAYGSSVKRNDPKETLARLLGCKQLKE